MKKFEEMTVEDTIKMEEQIARDGISIVIEKTYYTSLKAIKEECPKGTFRAVAGYYGDCIETIKPFSAITKTDYTPLIIAANDETEEEMVAKKLKKLRLKNLFQTS